jgi:hypothetical protein
MDCMADGRKTSEAEQLSTSLWSNLTFAGFCPVAIDMHIQLASHMLLSRRISPWPQLSACNVELASNHALVCSSWPAATGVDSGRTRWVVTTLT